MDQLQGVRDWRKLITKIGALRKSRSFLDGASNASYSIAEYAVQPILLVVSAPLLVPALGVDRYGVWMLATAISGTLGIFHVGLGDATIKYVSSYRGRNDLQGVRRILSGTLSLSAILGFVGAATIGLSSSFLVRHAFRVDANVQAEAIGAFRIAGFILFLQSIYQVLASALKGFELYGPPARVAVLTRTATILSAVVLVLCGKGLVPIMLCAALFNLIGAALLVVALKRMPTHFSPFFPFDHKTWAEVVSFGVYSWIQNLAGVVFSQADKFLIAAMLGPGPVTYYTLSVQVAQQIHALPSAGFGFLFPHMSASCETSDLSRVKKIYKVAVVANFLVAACMTLPLILFGKGILTIWMGRDFASHAYPVLAILAVGFALLSINVVPHFTLLGLGKVRFVSLVNIAGGIISLGAAALLIPTWGLVGAAAGRLLYGPIAGANFLKVARTI